MKLYNYLFCVLLIALMSCKAHVDDFDVYFLDSNDEMTELTSFEVRPYVVWQVLCSDVLSDDIDRHAGFTQLDIRYNWLIVNPIIQNNSENDLVLNSVKMRSMFYGEKGGVISGTDNVDSGCQFKGAETCQYCYPRTIPPGVAEDISINGDCQVHSGNDKSYKAARVNIEIEVISEVYGKMTKTVTLFASPKDEFSPPPDRYGRLLNSDGEGSCLPNNGWASIPTGWFNWGWWEKSGTTIYNRAPPIASSANSGAPTIDAHGGSWTNSSCCSLDE